MIWAKRLVRGVLGGAVFSGARGKVAKAPRSRRVAVEPLEDRRLLSVGGTFDFGDLPDNYGTTLAADGARHEATGPTLGALRDAEADGLPTVGADGDDTGGSADEDGVTFGEIMVGQLDAQVTVNVQNAPSGAKLDAWIDFNGDGSFGGAWERIAASVEVSEGDNTVQFDVPSSAVSGETYARFRVSSGGELGPSGFAIDGEVEDFQVAIDAPGRNSGVFESRALLAGAVPWSVFAADLDGDGDEDALSASGADNRIAWYENDGDGNFIQHTITTSANHAWSVFAADMDGDGDMDVLSASRDDNKIAWYENDGAGSFTVHTVTTSASGARSVFATDVDGDGDMDVLSASGSDGEIAWYENDGDAHFVAHTIATFQHSALSVSAEDLDADGDMDVLALHSNGLTWFENIGSEAFATHTISSFNSHQGAVVAADVDNDGDMDVLSASHSLVDDDVIAWYENDGSANFTTHKITVSNDGARAIFAVDMDGDGDIDAVSASMHDDKLAWHENDGSGSFTEHVITTSARTAGPIHAVDMDGDGDVDVLSGSLEMAWHENDGEGRFSGHTIMNAAVGPQSVFAADMDQDGDLDVLSASFWDDEIAWYENDGDNHFTGYSISAIAEQATDVFATDVDGDGDVDVLSASARDNKIAWYENDGSASFASHTITTSAPSAASVFAADVDGDGDVDVLSASGNKVAWYENDGDESFAPHAITTSLSYASSVFAADLDNDGDMDVLSASRFDDRIAWYENDGNANFTAHTIDASAEYAMSVFAVDVDGDGDTDVLSVSGEDDTIAWYENDGRENFTGHAIRLPEFPNSVFATDLDGDGDMDMLATAGRDNKIAWYVNDGKANFTSRTISTSSDGVNSVFAADVDGDGDLDILSAEHDVVTWYEQIGLPIVALDFGDAPDTYGTTLAADGARHELLGPSLGWNRDAESDGQPTVGADGDDNTDQPDEHGVRIGLVMPGQVGAVVTVPVQDAPNGAKLDAWIDFDGNGTFDAGDQIADSVDVVEGENVIRFDVPDTAVAGQTYARFRLSSAGDLGPTGPANDGEVEDHLVTIYPNTDPVDLGVVDFVEFPRFDPSTDGSVYTFTTKHAGYLTVLADEVVASGSLAVHLFDESGNLVGDTSTSTGDETRVELLDLTAGERYTVHVSGPESEVDLKIINLVEQVDGAVTVHGTDTADELYYQAGSTHAVTLNGLRYDLDPAGIGSIHFACGAGDDYVSMTGSAGDETAILRPDGGSMTTTATGFTVSAEDTERIAAVGGGGNDMVELIDGEGDDIFYIWAHRALLRNATEYGGLSPMTADDFRSVHVYAKAGGNDTAKFQGTDDAERVKVYPEIVKMTRGESFTRAKFFENVEVDPEGGTDTAIVTGSDGSDVVWASSYATRVAYDVDLADGKRPDLHYSAYGVSVVGCEHVVARGRGADDWLELHDSPVNDVLIAKPHRVDLMNGPRAEEGVERGAEYRITARGYQHVSAIADNAGDGDVAKLYDSGENGVDIWAAGYVDGETWSTMTSPSRLLYEVLAFEHVGGYGFNGGLGEDHGINRKDHADDVDFVFQHGYWEGDEEPGPTNPRDPRGR